MSERMNHKPEIQRQFVGRPAASILRRSCRNPGLILICYIRPVLENEWDQKEQQKSDQHSHDETPGRDYTDQQTDRNRVDLETSRNGHAKSCAIPALNVNGSDCGQQ